MYAKYIKRLLDILLSLTILVVLSPLLLVLCILVRSKLGSPIFFKQEQLSEGLTYEVDLSGL